MRTDFNKIICDWVRIKNHCRTTINQEPTTIEPNDYFKQKLVISEHSPIRLIEFDWTWRNIKYWVSTEWSRHKFEKFITSQRTDRTGTPRDELPQNAPVTFDGFANLQNLIDAWRKRLCFKATPEARELAEDFKLQLRGEGYEIESAVLVPNCVYRCGCPEFSPCGFFFNFLQYCEEKKIDITDIQERYKAYTEFLLNRKRYEME